MRRYYWFVLAFVALCAAPAHAAVPEHITLSAQIFEADSADAKSYQGAVTVELFASETGGTALWSELHPDKAIERGFLSLPLGALNTTTPLASVLRAHAGEELYIGVSVTPSGGATLSFPKRLPITSVPYALVCGSAANAQTLADKPLEYFAAVGASFTKAESDARYLAIDAPAKDAAKLGGQLPSAFAASAHTHDASYLAKTATAEDTKKLGGKSAESYAGALELGELRNTLLSAYYTIAELATHFFSKEELLPADANTPGALDSRYPFLAVGQTSNCRLKYEADLLSVVGRNGQDLSPRNACVIAIDDEEPLVFTKPIATKFGLGAASDVDGNTFGSTENIAWNTVRPFFLAACRGASGPLLGFSLNPAIKAIPAAVYLNGEVNADSQDSFVIMTVGINKALEVGKPCAAVGSFRATKSTKDEWIVASPYKPWDGFGKFMDGVQFTFPSGQNIKAELHPAGFATSRYFTVDTGTAPTPDEGVMKYMIDRAGVVTIRYTTNISSPGSQATPPRLALPYIYRPFDANSFVSVGYYMADKAAAGTEGTLFAVPTGYPYEIVFYVVGPTTFHYLYANNLERVTNWPRICIDLRFPAF